MFQLSSDIPSDTNYCRTKSMERSGIVRRAKFCGHIGVEKTEYLVGRTNS